MAGEETDSGRIVKIEQTLQTLQQSLQQITESLALLTTNNNQNRKEQANQEALNRNNQPPLVQFIRNQQPIQRPPPIINAYDRIRMQEQERNSEDSDLEEDDGDEGARGRPGLRRDAHDFDYRQRAKDVPSFSGSMNIEGFLDWMNELENFFQFYDIPGNKRVTLVAYKLKGGAQAWWKNLQTT